LTTVSFSITASERNVPRGTEVRTEPNKDERKLDSQRESSDVPSRREEQAMEDVGAEFHKAMANVPTPTERVAMARRRSERARMMVKTAHKNSHGDQWSQPNG